MVMTLIGNLSTYFGTTLLGSFFGTPLIVSAFLYLIVLGICMYMKVSFDGYVIMIFLTTYINAFYLLSQLTSSLGTQIIGLALILISIPVSIAFMRWLRH